MSSIKEARLAVTELLLRAGAFPVAHFEPGDDSYESGSEGEATGIEKERPTFVGDFMHAFAGLNQDSGGPEVLELLENIGTCPRSLKSSCRIEIRRHLSRPILLPGNVDKLPLSPRLKSFIAMKVV